MIGKQQKKPNVLENPKQERYSQNKKGKTKTRKNIIDMKKIIVACVVALVFIGTFVFLWFKSQPQPVEYDEFKATIGDVRKSTVLTGKIEPRNEVNVKPQISGIITEITKEAGQTVQAGEVIAKVKVIPDMAQLSSAQSRLRLAEINLKQALTDHEREKVLYDKGETDHAAGTRGESRCRG